MVLIDDRRRKLELDSELLVDDRDGALPSRDRLDNRTRKLAARKEIGLLAMHGNQIRLGQITQCPA